VGRNVIHLCVVMLSKLLSCLQKASPLSLLSAMANAVQAIEQEVYYSPRTITFAPAFSFVCS
jgi:hypothetical protein